VYTITAENLGDVEKDDLVIQDYLPDYTTFVSSPDGTLYKDGEKAYVEWMIDSLAPGEKVTFTFTVKVDEDIPYGQDIENTATYGNGKSTNTVTTKNTRVQDASKPGSAGRTNTPGTTSRYARTAAAAKTGDNTLIMVYGIALMLSGLGIFIFTLYRKKRKVLKK